MNRTIRASIDPRGLRQITDFFDHAPLTVFNELFQNSRRAGSASLDITTIQLNGGVSVRVRDWGKGIDDPETLLRLWASDWSEKTTEDENPAGCGFFSLSHLKGGVDVASRNWKIVLDAQAFTGEREVEVVNTERDIRGTTIEFLLENLKWEEVHKAIKGAGRYCPIPISINGMRVPQEDFLADALHVEEFEHYRVGIHKGIRGFTESRMPPTINFHGVILWVGAIQKILVERKTGWTLRVDMKSSVGLDLVKPARNAVIGNRKYRKLIENCELAIYRACQSQGFHDLPFRHYQRARDLGVELPLARPFLNRAVGAHEHADLYRYENNRGGPLLPERESYLSALSNPELLAFEQVTSMNFDLFQPDPEMEGYEWYPDHTIKSVTQVVFVDRRVIEIDPQGDANWKDLAPLIQENVRADKIMLRVEVQKKHGKSEVVEYPSSVAFDLSASGEDGIRQNWITTAEGFEEITDNFLEQWFFDYQDDCDCDSLETQRAEFQRVVDFEITRRKAGEKEALFRQIETACDQWEVICAMQQLELDKLVLVREDRSIKVERKPEI